MKNIMVKIAIITVIIFTITGIGTVGFYLYKNYLVEPQNVFIAEDTDGTTPEAVTQIVNEQKEINEPAAIAVESVSENEVIEKNNNLADDITFVSREKHAADSLPYYFKDYSIVRKADNKEIINAIPDLNALKEIFIDASERSVYDTCGDLFPDKQEQIAQLCTAFIRKDTNKNEYLHSIILAYSAYKKDMKGIDKIESYSSEITCYDISRKKMVINLDDKTIKIGSKEVAPDVESEEMITLSETIEAEYGYILPEEEERRAVIEEEERLLAEEEAAKLEEEQQAELEKQMKEQQKILAAIAAQNEGHPFTDKNGATTTFTNEEWEKLKNVWAYTGNGESYIGYHTIAELRQLLSNR